VTTTTQQHPFDLMPQLRDVLHLPEDLDLPKLACATFSAYSWEPGWEVAAQLSPLQTDLERWEALRAWGISQEPVLDEPSEGSHRLSGTWRKASVKIAVAEVTVEIWTHVDGSFTPPPAPLAVGDRVSTPAGRYGVVTALGCADPTCIADVTIRLDDDTVGLCWDSAELTLVKRAHTGDLITVLVPGTEDDEPWPTVVQSDSVYLDPAVRAAVHAECSKGAPAAVGGDRSA
jgi:hypothetical protein